MFTSHISLVLVTSQLWQADTIEEMLGEYRARHAKSDPETPEGEQYIDYRSRKQKTDFSTFATTKNVAGSLSPCLRSEINFWILFVSPFANMIDVSPICKYERWANRWEIQLLLPKITILMLIMKSPHWKNQVLLENKRWEQALGVGTDFSVRCRNRLDKQWQGPADTIYMSSSQQCLSVKPPIAVHHHCENQCNVLCGSFNICRSVFSSNPNSYNTLCEQFVNAGAAALSGYIVKADWGAF